MKDVDGKGTLVGSLFYLSNKENCNMNVLNFPSMKISLPPRTIKVFEFDNNGETDWVLAEDQESALKFLKEFHEEDEDEELLPGAAAIKFTQEIVGEELKKHTMVVHPEPGDVEKEETFHQFIENLKLSGEVELPAYLCGTMFL